MKLIRNFKTLTSNSEIAWNYLNYWKSKLSNSGRAIQTLPNDIKVTGLSGFSEFHCCTSFVNPEEWIFLKKHSIKSGAIIDIGANLGILSLILSKLYPHSQIHSFEPNPSTIQALKANIKLNNCNNIHIEESAVAEHDGEVYFNADPINRGTTSITTSMGNYSIKLPCTTLDTYVKEQSIEEIAFLKIDVEGYETSVFHGARQMLSQQQAQVIYYEVCPELTRKAGFSPELPTQILQQNGYGIYKLDEQGSLVPTDVSELNHVVLENWIAVRP